MAATEVSVMKELKGILATDNVKNRFNEVLGKKAPQFMTSIINVVSLCGQQGVHDSRCQGKGTDRWRKSVF